VFDVSSSVNGTVDFYNIARARSGQDTTNLFTRHLRDYPSCTSNARYAKTPTCKSTSAESGQTEAGTLQACPLGDLNNGTFSTLSIRNTSSQIGYSWANMQNVSNYLVIDGNVLNMNAYVAANPKPLLNDSVDTAIRTVLAQPSGGRDATRLFYNRAETREAVPCMLERYYAGKIDKISPGCFVSTLFLYVALGLIMGVILIRFAMACVFSWYLSSRMILPPRDLPRNAISPMVMPGGANRTVTEPDGAAPWRGGTIKRPTRANGGGLVGGKGSKPPSPEADKPAPLVTQEQIGQELFTVCLITCYSENLESIKGTCDSLALTDYSDNRKLLFIVADGMVTGSGETVSTPDICVGLLEADERFGNPMPMGYVAVGGGKLKENRAMVYAGHYGSYSFLSHASVMNVMLIAIPTFIAPPSPNSAFQYSISSRTGPWNLSSFF
jgi:chitin synthase